ncbi:MAG: hypothetical protein ABDH23_00340 [Endomicrobiia bacterium]
MRLVLITILLFFSCKKDTKKVEPSQFRQLPVKIETKEITTVTGLDTIPSKYVYEGLSYRDPFVPISPEKIAKSSLFSTGEAKIPSLGILQLKGFIVDKKEQLALFSSPYGRYILYNGKLYDNQNRLVRGFSGKIIFNKNTKQPEGVILIDENDEYKEYVLSR